MLIRLTLVILDLEADGLLLSYPCEHNPLTCACSQILR